MPAQTPVVITARLNETRPRGANPHLPISSAELVEAGLRAAEAGAAILHWHARDPEGTGLGSDPDLYWEVTEGIRSRVDVLIEPGVLFYRLQPAERIQHVTEASGDPARRPDLVPVEMGPFSTDVWNPAERRFENLGGIYELGNDRIHDLLALLKEHRQPVAAACWGPGQVRTARCFQEMGVLPAPALWELVFTGDSFPGGPPPSLPLLKALVAELPPGQPWLTYTWNGDGLEMAGWSIELGGHVGIGLGDHEYANLGTPTNAELVGQVARLAAAAGRAIASVAETRRLLGLPSRSRVGTP